MRSKVLLTILSLFVFSINVFAADSLGGMFNEGTVSGELRAYSYHYNIDDEKVASDNAVGGFVYLKTGKLHGISFGVTFATANDFYSDKDTDGYGLLQARNKDNQHESYTKMMEYYVRGEWFDTTITYGAQEIYTPLMNMDYCRMLPKTYRGLTIVNRSIENLELNAYYITGFSNWTDSGFDDISLSVSDESNKPLLVAGARYKLPAENLELSFEGWEYHMDDIIDMQYLRPNIGGKIGNVGVYFMPTVVFQNSIGDEAAGEYKTGQYGFETGFDTKGIFGKAFYAKTGDDDFFAPWGFGKIVMMQWLCSDRAEEEVYSALLGYHFDQIGIKGFSAYVWYGNFNTPDSGENYSPDVVEMNYNVQYAFGDSFGGALKGLSIEIGYATMDYVGADDQSEIKSRIKYSFAFGK